jgi:hypothetical protein
MNYEAEAARVAQACRRKDHARAVLIMGADSVRTCPAHSPMGAMALAHPGFVGVYDARVQDEWIEEDLEWVARRVLVAA